MRSAMVGLLAVVVVFSSAGCSRRSKKHKKEPLQITTTSLPDATEGIAYSYTLQAAGGNSSNYTWSISGQPSWLSIDASTGELSGTPPAGSAGSYTFTVEITDGQQTAQADLSLTVTAAPTSLQITTSSLPDATEGVSYSATIEATGGTTPYTWSVSGLPSGLTWTQVGDAVEISGTPDVGTAGTYSVDVTVTDSSSPNQSASATLQLVVNPAGSTWYVDALSGSDLNSGTSWSDAFKTIAHALNVAQDGDTILVADGTYHEHDLDFQGKKVHLKSANGPTNCIIDCQQLGRAFYFHSGETADSVLEGFTIQNGKVEDTYGGAIACNNNSSPTIKNCVFQNNKVADTNNSYVNENGGAICCWDNSSPTISDCIFSGNRANSYGGAICCEQSSGPTVTNCIFIGNRAEYYGGAIACNNYSNPTLINCVFSGNSASYGGAISCTYSDPSATNCTFSGNSADKQGGAVYCNANNSPVLNNCILWNNTANSGGNEIYIGDSGSFCTLNSCCIDSTGYGGVTGNIAENNCIHDNPQFVDADGADNIVGTDDDNLHLQNTSPCIDAGDNTLVPPAVDKDLDGSPRIVNGIVDIGAYEKQ